MLALFKLAYKYVPNVSVAKAIKGDEYGGGMLLPK
jgi:hypothetical protein